MKLISVIFTVSVIGLSYAGLVKNWQVTAKGCIRCYGQPMSYVLVRLMDKDLFIDQKMKTGKAGRDGCFELTGKGRDGLRGKPDPYIRVEYAYSGGYGHMEVENWVGVNRKGHSPTKKYSKNINFGTLHFSSIHCKSYLEFYKALKNYRSRTNLKLPYSKLRVKTGIILHGGTPYALTSQVRIPNKYSPSKLTYRTALHEFAHTIRHTYDGSLVHFLSDVVKHKYMQHHKCSKKTNHGFAFNEGWAEFWAGTCYGTYGSSKYDYRYEGNVAKALRKLKLKCGRSYRDFILVLKSNKKSIHSFYRFNLAHGKKYGCKL